MVFQKYKIFELSARAVMSYGTETEDGYEFNLNNKAVDDCLITTGTHEQDSNALFFQILDYLHGGKYREKVSEKRNEELSELLFYMNFQGVFDTKGLRQREVIRQKKAEFMFKPEGITLDFGNSPQRYVSFERSGNMSRSSRLSFIRKDLYDPIRKRIMLDMELSRCIISKLYAYNGLMLSSGKRVEGIRISKQHRVIVIPNPHMNLESIFQITVNEDGGPDDARRFYRIETNKDINTTCFDGEGLISPEYAAALDKAYCGTYIHSSFQIRMPYVKGMLHVVDFKSFLKKYNIRTIRDIWGERHPIDKVDVILTVSQFKAFGWFRDCHMTWNDYWKAFRKYNHALYITNVNKTVPEGLTELNYQFLATISIEPEEFRPADLPAGWNHSPSADPRQWLTKDTELQYYNFCSDEYAQRNFFLQQLQDPDISPESKNYRMAEVLYKNPLFLHEPVFRKQLEAQAERIIKGYAVGKLLVPGDIRYLSGDLLDMLYRLAEENRPVLLFEDDISRDRYQHIFAENSFYAPGAVYKNEGNCTLLRNPHIARNEEIQLNLHPVDEVRDHLLGHLTDVVMVDDKMLAAERLGGADYDGDLVRTISSPILNRCVQRNYDYEYHHLLNNKANIPLLVIPSLQAKSRETKDWHANFETVKNTFSSRIGQICNAALDRSVLAYNEHTPKYDRKQYRYATETLAILSGLEIDAAKTGVRPDLSKYLQNQSIPRSAFLKYKAMAEQSEERRKWYEDTPNERVQKFFKSVDWEQLDSPVERLPYLAYRLQKETPKKKAKKIPDSQLFSFAENPDWKSHLDPVILSNIKSILSDYEKCLSRIRSCRIYKTQQNRRSDIERILYRRGQEEQYDPDELYALFKMLPPEQVHGLRTAIREQHWELKSHQEAETFLRQFLPGADYAEWYDLLTDFRHYGFRILADVVADIEDTNSQDSRKQLYRKDDSPQFGAMMHAYDTHSRSAYYRDAVAKECRSLISMAISPGKAVPYVVALGKRNLLWELLPDKILGHVRKMEVTDNA